MPIKFTAENSKINVDTFVDAPETADLDLCVKNSTEIKAGTMFKIHSKEDVYRSLSISEDYITKEQLVVLVDKAIELNQKGEGGYEDKLLDYANTVSICTSIASSEPLIAVVSGLCALAYKGGKHLLEVKDALTK